MKKIIAFALSFLLLVSCGTQKNAPSPYAPFASEKEMDRFIALVQDYFHSKNLATRLENGTIWISQGEYELEFGLSNIAQICAQANQEDWPSLIAAHFDSLLVRLPEVQVTPLDFQKTKDKLMIRLYSQDSGINDESSFFLKNDLEGTVSVIVIDDPTSTRTLRRDQTLSWKMSEQDIFELALKNTQTTNHVKSRHLNAPNGVTLIVLSENSFYVASQALFLEKYPECIGKYGALVGVPTRDYLICFPINDITVKAAVQAMIPAISKIEQVGPGSISPDLFWYQDGKFVRLPYKLSSDSVVFDPPASFSDLVREVEHGNK
jgi:hypothetical protein